jgi:hypothetical protein
MTTKKENNKVKKVEKATEVSVKVWGKVYSATGDSVLDALSKIKIQNAKGRAVLSVTYDGKKEDRILMPLVSARLFNSNGLTKQIALKQTAQLFI